MVRKGNIKEIPMSHRRCSMNSFLLPLPTIKQRDWVTLIKGTSLGVFILDNCDIKVTLF